MLSVGTDPSVLSRHLPERFLFIDPPKLRTPKHIKTVRLNFDRHHYNPLKDIDYAEASAFIDILDGLFPAGGPTLTKETAHIQILEALLQGPKRLDSLISDTKDTAAAFQKIKRIFLSPVLKKFLRHGTSHLPFDGILLASLEGLTDFDRFLVGNLLISEFQGHIFVPEYGRYACPFHKQLVRDGRLSVHVYSLKDVPWLKDMLHHFHKEEVFPRHANAEDAETLAIRFSGHKRDAHGFSNYVQSAMN
jgi:hypothetical protein